MFKTFLAVSWEGRGVKRNRSGDLREEKEAKEQEEAFYQQAYEGFMKAMSTEMFPMCGMDQCTVDYLLAAMAYHFKNMMWLLSVFQESRLHLLHRKR